MFKPGSKDFPHRLDLTDGRVELAHGAGARDTTQLIEELFLEAFDNLWLKPLDDQVRLPRPEGRLVVSTDAHVVSPLFFPGGDLGTLAVNGAVNDLAMSGARPLYLTVAFILEEGFALQDLARIVTSLAQAALEARVPVVAGDTKVVERGKGDGIYLTTTGIGSAPPHLNIAADRAEAEDRVIVSGPLGEHGIALLASRDNLALLQPVRSDTAPLHELVAAMTATVPDLHCLRDLTRGGLATALCTLARQSMVKLRIDRETLPVGPGVQTACDSLGLDPLHLACEGRLVAICPAHGADALLTAMQAHPLGRGAAIIGEVVEEGPWGVELAGADGTVDSLDWPAGGPIIRAS